MAWKFWLFVVLINIILISQGELEKVHANSSKTRTTASTMSPEETGTQISEDPGPLLAEATVLGKLDQEPVTDMIMMASVKWTEDSITVGTATTTEFNALIPQVLDTKCKTYKFVIRGLMVLMSVLGFIGNTCSFIVFWPDHKKSANTILLLQLAVVDTLVLVSWLYLYMADAIYLDWFDPPPGWLKNMFSYVSVYGWGIGNSVHMIACWLIVVITAQRYMAVCHPHKMCVFNSIRLAWIQLAVLVVFNTAFNIPHFLEVRIVYNDNAPNGMIYSNLGNNDAYYLYYKFGAFYVIQFVIPLGLLIFFTTALIRKLKKIKDQLKSKKAIQPSATSGVSTATKGTDSQNQQDKNKKDDDDTITLALIVVDVIFIICQLFKPIRQLTDQLIPPEDRGCGTVYFYYAPITTLGILFNSAINFLIFCICAKGFRKLAYKRL